MKQTIALIYLLSIIAVAVFPFSSVGVTGLTKVHVISFRLDHLLHLAAFFPFYPLAVWVVKPSGFMVKSILLLAGLTFAALAEYAQLFVDYRTYYPADMIANMVGVLAGFLAYIMAGFIFRKRG